MRRRSSSTASASREHYRLYDNALFQTSISELRWNEDDKRWTIRTNRGDAFKAQYVIIANGPLHRPKLPGIPGINEFKGYTFHTSRWDYRYTGGDSYGNLHRLKDKRVGIIGTGATAVQCIPHLGEAAKHLYVFQRTPSSIDVRNNAETDPAWAAALEPGWQKRRMENFNILVSGGDQDEDMVHDGWTDIFRNLTAKAVADASLKLGRKLTSDERNQLLVLADYKKMNQIRARVDEIVKDEATAEALKPWYRQFCKRPCFHDEYLPTYNRPNVTLVDTRGHGVDRLTERGIVANGQEYPIDCLIFATGFEVGTAFTRQRRLRRDRPRRQDAVAALVGRHAHAARHDRARLSELLLRRPQPVRDHGEPAALAGEPDAARELHPQPGPRTRLQDV